MPSRIEVYASIDGERDYQESRWRHTCVVEGKPYKPDEEKTTAEYLSFIAGYNADLLHAVSHVAGVDDTLDVFRKLAALCVACMEANGGCPRDLNTGRPGDFIEPLSLNRRKVYRIIDTEREYQESLGDDRTDHRKHTVSGYVVMFQHYLQKAHEQWTIHPGDEYCLDVVRKLAAITVHCMEDHGLIFREPFQA